MDTFYCKRLSSTAIIPTKGSPGAAGFDLYADEDVCFGPIYSGESPHALVSTGISVQIPRGWYGRIAPRSGLAVKYGMDVLAGVIDSDYTGEIKVILHCTKNLLVNLKKGERIAQLIIEKCGEWNIMEVSELENTERGDGGFGSTGK